MARFAPDNESDYGYDFTAEEEELVAALINVATSPPPAVVVPGRDNEPVYLPALPWTQDGIAPPDPVPAGKTQPRSVSVPLSPANIGYPDLTEQLAQVPPSAPPEPEAEREQAAKSPLERFRTFPKKPFSVSDFTAGTWCEMQYYYVLTRLPGGRRTRSAAMKEGSRVHDRLEQEVRTAVHVDTTTKEEAFGVRLWNIVQGLRTLREDGLTRELEVWGEVDGHIVNGKIDGLSYRDPKAGSEEDARSSQEDGKQQGKITEFFPSTDPDKHRQVYVLDVKTRGTNTIPTGDALLQPVKIQLFMYRRFLADMAAGKLDFLRVVTRYGLDPDKQFSDGFIAQMGALHDEIFGDDSQGMSDATMSSQLASNSSDLEYVPSETASGSIDAIPVDEGAQSAIKYRTLRELVPIVESELRLTFPRGASSIGPLVTAEYRRRPTPAPEPNSDVEREAEDEVQPQPPSEVIGSNVFRADDAVLDEYLAEDMEWWRGERQPRGVRIEETYKCRMCEFADGCEWRAEQDKEILQRAREKATIREEERDGSSSKPRVLRRAKTAPQTEGRGPLW